jgi:hypothetical protein
VLLDDVEELLLDEFELPSELEALELPDDDSFELDALKELPGVEPLESEKLLDWEELLELDKLLELEVELDDESLDDPPESLPLTTGRMSLSTSGGSSCDCQGEAGM